MPPDPAFKEVAPPAPCVLERFGAPAWACRILWVFLAIFVPAYGALVMMSGSWGHSRLWFLPLITVPVALVLALIFVGRGGRR